MTEQSHKDKTQFQYPLTDNRPLKQSVNSNEEDDIRKRIEDDFKGTCIGFNTGDLCQHAHAKRIYEEDDHADAEILQHPVFLHKSPVNENNHACPPPKIHNAIQYGTTREKEICGCTMREILNIGFIFYAIARHKETENKSTDQENNRNQYKEDSCISAEGLDIIGNNIEEILINAEKNIKNLIKKGE